MQSRTPQPEFCRVHFRRLEIARDDISLSYSADEIAAGRPVRTPFEHGTDHWICTGMRGANATSNGLSEFEAYRLWPRSSFAGKAVNFKMRTGTDEARAMAEADPNGLYHGVLVKFGRAKSVLCGPPVIFVACAITKRKSDKPPPAHEHDPAEIVSSAAEPPSSAEEPEHDRAPVPAPTIHIVPAARLTDDAGDINASYSADRIGSDDSVRRPFKYDGALWVCTSIRGSALTANGSQEHEAYRLLPERLFIGPVATYSEKTGTAENAEAARNDPNGFYHGMKVKFASAAFVLCGPPAHFIAAERPGIDPLEPAQLSLF